MEVVHKYRLDGDDAGILAECIVGVEDAHIRGALTGAV